MPSLEQLVIDFSLSKAEEVQILLTDLMGKPRVRSFVSGAEGKNSITLDLKELPGGIYMFQLSVSGYSLIPIKILKL